MWPFNKVNDALGVVYTHGIAGLLGGLMVGLFADPKMVVYLGLGNNADVTTSGPVLRSPEAAGHPGGRGADRHRLGRVVTFLLLKGIGLFMKLRIPDAELEIGDVAVHGEEVYPSEELVRVGAPGTPGRGCRPDRAARRTSRSASRRRCPARSDAPGRRIIGQYNRNY